MENANHIWNGEQDLRDRAVAHIANAMLILKTLDQFDHIMALCDICNAVANLRVLDDDLVLGETVG